MFQKESFFVISDGKTYAYRTVKEPTSPGTQLRQLGEREEMIEHSQAIHRLEQRLLDERGRLIEIQRGIVDGKKALVEIRNSLRRLNEFYGANEK